MFGRPGLKIIVREYELLKTVHMTVRTKSPLIGWTLPTGSGRSMRGDKGTFNRGKPEVNKARHKSATIYSARSDIP